MTFDVAGSAYDLLIGRYARLLAPRFLSFAGMAEGPVLDVGCGPGALTEVLAERMGGSNVAGVDPSEPFIAACRARAPGVDVRRAFGEALPFGDGAFAGALCQLVLSFVRDAPRTIAEMARVVRPGGVVAACTFEANGFALARTFWDAALRLDPGAPDDARLPMRRRGELEALFGAAPLLDVTVEDIVIEARYADFEDFWAPLSSGVGSAASYLVAQDEARRHAIRDACFEILGRPSGAFELPALVLAIRGRVAP